MSEILPKRTNFRHTVPTFSPLGWVYRWVMSATYRRYKLEQALSAFWLPIVYEEIDSSIPVEELQRIAIESIQALESQAQVLRFRYKIENSAHPHNVVYSQYTVVPTTQTAPNQQTPEPPITRTPTSEIDYSEFLFDDELAG